MSYQDRDSQGQTTIEFPWYEYVIFGSTLIISLGIGIYSALTGDKGRTANEYLMANRQLGLLPVTLSMLMSYTSAILVLGSATEMYTFGIHQWFYSVGSSLAFILSAVTFVSLFYPLNITSTFEVSLITST